MNLKFYSFQHHNIAEDLSHDQFPVILRIWKEESLDLPAVGTHFGFVYQGHPVLSRQTNQAWGEERYSLHPGMYFCLPNQGKIEGKNSAGIIISYLNYKGVFSLGGSLESTGRLAYIDGGTNSVLIPPILVGNPCINGMYFPPNINQTMHTHPSYRIGIIVEGSVEIETPKSSTHLESGSIFLIPANSLHKFNIHQKGLTAVMFHPDSNTGYTHQNNPMLKRTIVNGVSAANLSEIQTQNIEIEL
ncbi:MAG: AraC family ligand binding domain-containing protein [Microcoleaceae cyanobacterium]